MLRRFFAALGVPLAIASFAFATVERARPAAPSPAPLAPLSGTHRSACEKIRVDGRSTYSRLAFRFVGKRYASSETLYTDPKCEISVLEMASQGVWSIERGNVLELRLARMQYRPLDPRLADSLQAKRNCGKKWENGEWNEILGTSCAKVRTAEYFITPSPSGKSFALYECEGRRTIGKGCTRYNLARDPGPVARR